MSRLFVDVVRDESAGRVMVVVFLAKAGSAMDATPSDGVVPDPRFANSRAIDEWIATRAGIDERPEAWLASAGEGELATERLLDVFEWCVWTLLGRGQRLTGVVVAERVGARGESRATAPRLPDPDDLLLVLRRIARDARRLGFDVAPPPPGISLVPFGVPRTPVGLSMCRYLGACSLEAGTAEIGGRWPWVRTAPASEAMRELRRLVPLVEERPARPMALARVQTAFVRSGGTEAEFGTELAQAALRRVVEEAAVASGTPVAGALLRTTIGEIRGVADARQGDYESCELVLRLLCDRPEAGAAAPLLERALGDDPWAVAQAYVTRARIANHRGDHARSIAALARAREIGAAEESIRMRLLMIEAGTLFAVATQNEWPFQPDDAGAQRRMAQVASWLEAAIEGIRPGTGMPKDPTLAAALGTLGRTYAFLGRHDDAAKTLRIAREGFVSAIDLRMNAIFLAHNELDRPGPVDAPRIGEIFDLIAAPEERTAPSCLSRLQAGDAGFRFVLDVILKGLLLGIPSDSGVRDAWLDALAADAPESLLASLQRLRSHPTELVARHAGEVLRHARRTDVAARWFALGSAVGVEGGPTLQRMATFTDHLGQGGVPSVAAPRGSILNPCYEYR